MKRHSVHDGAGSPIRCDPDGHCQWIGPGTVAAARLRIHEANRGPLQPGARLESTCGGARCVNLDHLRRVAVRERRAERTGPFCQRGHELTGKNVVRHRDGRVAYCRTCRNQRRRDRYRTDRAYARHEIERQRERRRSAR